MSDDAEYIGLNEAAGIPLCCTCENLIDESDDKPCSTCKALVDGGTNNWKGKKR